MARRGLTTEETGSLVNLLSSRQDKAEVMQKVRIGDGATILSWSDRHAVTVIDIRGTEKRPVIVIQQDRQIRTDGNGLSESQSYRFERDYAGAVHEVSFRKGAWRIKGDDRAVAFGYRSAYRDPSF